MRLKSHIMRAAADTYARCRAEYEDYLEAHYAAAEKATNGHMVNARGRARGVQSWSLFRAAPTYVNAYASEELVEFWRTTPRVTFDAFEKAWLTDNREQVPA